MQSRTEAENEESLPFPPDAQTLQKNLQYGAFTWIKRGVNLNVAYQYILK